MGEVGGCMLVKKMSKGYMHYRGQTKDSPDPHLPFPHLHQSGFRQSDTQHLQIVLRRKLQGYLAVPIQVDNWEPKTTHRPKMT